MKKTSLFVVVLVAFCIGLLLVLGCHKDELSPVFPDGMQFKKNQQTGEWEPVKKLVNNCANLCTCFPVPSGTCTVNSTVFSCVDYCAGRR